MQPENAREFSIAVSEIVRQYIEERFRVWAARRTTEEFSPRLARNRPTLCLQAIALCWRIFSVTATSRSSPGGFSRPRDGNHARERLPIRA